MWNNGDVYWRNNEKINKSVTFHNAWLGQVPWGSFQRSTEHEKTRASDWKVNRKIDLDSLRKSTHFPSVSKAPPGDPYGKGNMD